MKLPCLVLALLATAAIADDKLRDVQAELKSQGFYYSEVNGTDGPETTSAIRRFQIRNGLAVTGKLDDETLAALGMAEAKSTPPSTAAVPKAKPKGTQLNPPPPGEQGPPATARPRQDLLRDQQNAETNPPPAGTPYVDGPGMITPPTRIPSAVDDDEYATFFHGTPYAKAPVEVQFDIVRKAQNSLAKQGYYRGAVNGLPATLTSEAIFSYQTKQRLPRTGRLDLQTLADLNLLPGRGGEAPAARPFYNPNRQRDRSVDFRGFVR